MNPSFPDSGFTAFGPGDARSSTSVSSDQVPDDFNQDVVTALWEEGVDISVVGVQAYHQFLLAAWQDPYLQDLYQSGTEGASATDPLTGANISNFTPYIKKELFDPLQTHSQLLVSQGIGMLTLSGKPLTSSQQTYGQNLGGGSPAVLSALSQAAKDAGVPYNVALAVAMAESGLDPKAVGDNGDSIGLFQLNIHGEGAGMSVAQREDPYQNALIALRQFAAVAAADPSVTSDPGRWAALAQRPEDPSGYATRVNNLIQSGFGGSPSGLVPKPFDGNYPITEDHSQGDPGIDYGTPVGTAMYTPFAGTIRVEDHGKNDWGKRAMVVLDNGYTFGIGHLTSFSVVNGQRVNPGDLLGLSGGALSDPSSGDSTGPHVELQWISPGGNFLDPHAILDPIFTGNATFRSLNLTGAEGSGVSATSAKNRALGIDPILEAKYPTALSEFEKFFGRHPTSSELLSLIQHGTTADALDAYLRQQPSHIPGISIGMYQDVKGNLDSVSQSLFGHAGTDGMVKELVDQGKTSPTAVKFWLEQQDIAGKMDPGQYQTLYQLNAPHMQAIYNQTGFDPRIATQQYQAAQQQGITVPSMPLTPGDDPLGLQAFPHGPADRNQPDTTGGAGSEGNFTP